MLRLPEKQLRACCLISAVSAAAAIALTVRRWLFDTAAVDAIYYAVHPMKTPSPAWPFLLAALSLLLSLQAVGRVEWFGRKAAPCWLLWILLILPNGFLNLAATLATTAWTMTRCLELKSPRRPLSGNAVTGIAALLAAAVAGWSIFIQIAAFRGMILAYSDWGEYSECYLRLADGAVPWRSWAAQAGHFNPVPNLLMSTVFRIWRLPEAVFLVAALLLGSLPPLVCRLAREYELPRRAAVLCGVAAAFSPVLINQSLSLFYGFHPVLFQGPLIIGFFFFERRKDRLGMAAMIALSFLIQETAAVLWFGYALYLLACKRFRVGALLAAACVAYFALVSKVVIPFAAGGTDNPQLFHYAQLGDSLGAVVASPILRPRAFWGTVFQKQNLFFAAVLLLPCGVLALRAPRRLLMVLPLFVGVIMQNSNDVKNPSMQYGFEITVVLLCAAVAAAGNLLGRRTADAKTALRAGIRTMAAMSLLCAFFWSRLPVGKYSAMPILKFPDTTAAINTLRGYSKPGGRVLSTKRLRLYHMFDRQVAPLASEWKTGDTVVLDFDDPLEPVDDIRRRLLDDTRAIPVFPQKFTPSRFAVWKIGDGPRPPWNFIRSIGETDFRRLGPELQQDDRAFEARVAAAPDGRAWVAIRLKTAVDYDVKIVLKSIRNGETAYQTVCFGSIYPAWCAKPGDTYIIPIDGGLPQALQLAITPRR